MNFFDRKAEFHEQVEPLMDQLLAKCEELNIPMLTAVCFANTAGEDGWHDTCLVSGGIDGEKAPVVFHAAQLILRNQAHPHAIGVLLATAKPDNVTEIEVENGEDA